MKKILLFSALVSLMAACKKDDETDQPLLDCEKNNTGTVIFSNLTNDDWDIYVNGTKVGWVYEFSGLTKELSAGSKSLRFVQTDFIFTPDEKFGTANVIECNVVTVNIN